MNLKFKERYSSYLINNLPSLISKLANNNLKYKVCVLSSDLIGRSFAVTGAYEAAGVSAVDWLCKQGTIRKPEDSIFIDIGANIGTYSLALAPSFKEVLAFEPHPIVSKVLELNKEIKNFNNIHICKYGLSDMDTETSLYEPMKNAGGSSLEHRSSGASYTVKVKHVSVAINSLKKGNKIAFIKIDVEGHELKVMQGLKEVLLQYKPVVAFEANDLERNESLLEYMQSLGYTKFLALDIRLNSRYPILRLLLVSIFGAKYELKPVQHLGDQKYSLVFSLY